MLELFEKAAEAVRKHHHFVITTHINPDGDGVGSELGLARFLKTIGKDVIILNATPTPRNYRFLDPGNEIKQFDASRPAEFLNQTEVIFILDISKWERLGPMRASIQDHKAVKICIDHHPINGEFADINLICQDACASGELVLELMNHMNGELTAAIAEPLYAAILTDTGAFRFPNTTSQTHYAAAKLLATGINPHCVYEHIYERCSPARVQLLGIILCNLNYLHCGRLAWAKITQTMLQQTGVEPEEVEGFVDIARGIRNVEASFLFLELPDGKVKVSLRSKGDVDVNRFASKFGGGGHQHASGILLDGPIETVANNVLQETASLFHIAEKLVS